MVFMKAADIQKALYYHISKKNHTHMCPNKHLDNWWECDMVSITPAGYLHEFEIKISRADFKNDFKKGAKHIAMESNYNGDDKFALIESIPNGKGFRRRGTEIVEGKTYTKISISHLKCPSYFWFVTPVGLLKEEDIPEYAGWLEVSNRYNVIERKSAPRLSKKKVTEKVKDKITTSMVHRFWQMKLKQ